MQSMRRISLWVRYSPLPTDAVAEFVGLLQFALSRKSVLLWAQRTVTAITKDSCRIRLLEQVWQEIVLGP